MACSYCEYFLQVNSTLCDIWLLHSFCDSRVTIRLFTPLKWNFYLVPLSVNYHDYNFRQASNMILHFLFMNLLLVLSLDTNLSLISVQTQMGSFNRNIHTIWVEFVFFLWEYDYYGAVLWVTFSKSSWDGRGRFGSDTCMKCARLNYAASNDQFIVTLVVLWLVVLGGWHKILCLLACRLNYKYMLCFRNL